MKIKTTDFASGRTRDGRQFTALEGATIEVDDNDQDMADLFRSFVGQGVAVLVDETAGDSETPGGGERQTDGEPPATQETETERASQPTEPRKTTTAAKKAGRSQ